MQRFIYALLFCSLLITACVSDQENQTTDIPEVEVKTVTKKLPKTEVTVPETTVKTVNTTTPTKTTNTTPTPAKTVNTPPPTKTVKTTPPPTVTTTTTTQTSPPPTQVNTQKQTTTTPTTTTKTKVVQPAPKPLPVRPAGAPAVKLLNPIHNYGYIAQGDVIKKVFTLKNTGNAPLNILNTTASCGCTRPEYSFMPILPGETSDIRVTFNSTGKLGRVQSKVTVLTDAVPAEYELYLEGTVTDKKSTQKPDKPVAQKDDKKDEEKPSPDKEEDNKEAADTPDNKKIDDKEVEEEVEQKDEKKGQSRPILPGRKLPKGNQDGGTETDSGN